MFQPNHSHQVIDQQCKLQSEGHHTRSLLEKHDRKFWIFQIQTCCVTYIHAKMLYFLQKFVFKKPSVKEMKSAPSDDELVLMFLNKKRRKRRFWVCPILKRRQQRGEISLFGPGVDTVSWPLLYSELLFKSPRVSKVKLNHFIISIFSSGVHFELQAHLLPNAAV